jgi:hypothetical protein
MTSLAALLDEFPFEFRPLQRLPPFLELPADHQLAVFQDLRFGAARGVKQQFEAVGVPFLLDRPQIDAMVGRRPFGAR